MTPNNGTSHLLINRAQGAMRFYAAGLGDNGKLVIRKNDFGFTTLAECDFDWQIGQTYDIELRCVGDKITLSVDGQEKLTAEDASFTYGMFGCGSTDTGRTSFGNFTFKDL